MQALFKTLLILLFSAPAILYAQAPTTTVGQDKPKSPPKKQPVKTVEKPTTKIVDYSSKTLLNETFTTQTTKFTSPGEQDGYGVVIANGWYDFHNKNTEKQTKSYTTLSNFNSLKDFTISCDIFLVDASKYGVGICWGDITNKGYYRFEIIKNIAGDLKYTIYKANGADIKPWTISSLVKSNQWNSLAVKKRDNTYYFYINNEEIFSTPFEHLAGNHFGIIVPPSYYGHFDNYKVEN